MAQIQVAELLRNLSAYFVRRNEPNYAWGNAVGGLLWTPRLRGLWPMSSVNEGGNVYDVSGQGRTLTNNNAVTFSVAGLAAYANFVRASSQYLSRATEAGLEFTSSFRWAGWVWFDSLGGAVMDLASKWNSTSNNRGWRVFLDTTGVIGFQVSSDGTAVTSLLHTTPLAISTWYYVDAMYQVSTRLAVRVNADAEENTTSIPASINNSTADFLLGAVSSGAGVANALDGRMSLPLVASGAVGAAVRANTYQQTRGAFGV